MIPARTLVISRTWIRKEMVRISTRTSRMENGMMSLNTCSSTSVKADIRYSAEQVLWNEDPCEAKEVENLSIHFWTLWKRQFEKVLSEHGWEKVPTLRMLIRKPRKRTILVCVCGRYKTVWKETEHRPNVKNTHEIR